MSWTCDGDSIASQYRQSVAVDETQLQSSDLDIYTLITKDFTDDFRDSDLSASVDSGGATVRVCTNDDGTGRLAIDIVSCVPNATGSLAEIEIKVAGAGFDNLTSGQELYVFWGGSGNTQPAVDATYGREAVYPTGRIQWEFASDPAGTAPQLIDRSSNDMDGTANGGMTSGDLVDGQIGDAWDFDGFNDYVTAGTSSTLNPTSFTLGAWVKSDKSISNNGDYWAIVQRGSVFSSGYGIHFYDRLTLDGFEVWTRDGSLKFAKADDVVSGAAINDWHFVVGTYDSGTTTLKIYVDGVEEGSNSSAADAPTTTLDFRIGEDNGNSELAWDGPISTVLLHNSAKTADWIADYYSNTKSGSTLFSAGTFTDGSGGGGGGGGASAALMLLSAI